MKGVKLALAGRRDTRYYPGLARHARSLGVSESVALW